jgi:hypothetical protein
MAHTVSGIEAALLEAKGIGSFSLDRRTIKFRQGANEWKWHCATDAEAARQLRIFRAAPKYMVAA